jgi:hypothetical protein
VFSLDCFQCVDAVGMTNKRSVKHCFNHVFVTMSLIWGYAEVTQPTADETIPVGCEDHSVWGELNLREVGCSQDVLLSLLHVLQVFFLKSVRNSLDVLS